MAVGVEAKSDAHSAADAVAVPYLAIGSYFLASRALILLIAFLSLNVIEKSNYFSEFPILANWFNKWDSAWYLSIVQHGYQYLPGEQMSNVAFFPLFPALVRLLTFFGLQARTAGYVVSNLALLGTALVMWKLTVFETGDKRAGFSAVLFLLLGPVTFFLSCIYTESLFLLLTTGSLYFARRGLWLKAGVCGYLAALTRAYGFLIALPILWELASVLSRSHASRTMAIKYLLCCFLPFAGLGTYMMFLWLMFGEPLAFQKAAHSGWGRSFAPFWVGINNLFTGSDTHSLFYRVWFIASWFLGLALIWIGFFLKMNRSCLLWCILLFGLLVSTTKLESLPRYLSGIAPYYIILAQLGAKAPRVELWLTVSSAMLLSLSVIMFVNGYWFT